MKFLFSLFLVFGFTAQFFLENKYLYLTGIGLVVLSIFVFCLYYLIWGNKAEAKSYFLTPFILVSFFVLLLNLYYRPYTHSTAYFDEEGANFLILFTNVQWLINLAVFGFCIGIKRTNFLQLKKIAKFSVVILLASLVIIPLFLVFKTKYQNWLSKRCEQIHAKNLLEIFPIGSNFQKGLELCSVSSYRCEKNGSHLFVSPLKICPGSQRDFCGFHIILSESRVSEIRREGACH